MKLKIALVEKNQDFVISLPYVYLGTKHIDEIRECLGCNLPLDRIKESVSEMRVRKFIMKIHEEDARRLNLCIESGIEEIQIEKNSLNELFYLKPHAIKNDETGEIMEAWMEWKAKYKKAIKFIEEIQNNK